MGLTSVRRRVPRARGLGATTTRALFREAWEAAVNDYDASVAAHYVAHLASDPQEALRWHLVALEHGRLDERAAEFMGSLLVSLGGAYECLGQFPEAERSFALAAEQGVRHVGPGLDASASPQSAPGFARGLGGERLPVKAVIFVESESDRIAVEALAAPAAGRARCVRETAGCGRVRSTDARVILHPSAERR